jgi:hypothetical protein
MMNRPLTFLAITAVSTLLGCSAMAQNQTGQPAKTSSRDIGLTIYSSADPAGFDPQQFISQQRMGYNPQAAWQVPGFGVVRDVRALDLAQGGNTVSFTDVAEFIDPTTVSMVDLSVPAASQETLGIKVLQQKFAFDLVSPQKLLDSYIDRDITVNQSLGDGKTEAITGRLLSNNQGRLVLQTDKGIRMLAWGNDVQLGQLPGGLITKPTLQWDIFAPRAGQRQVRTAYQTAGITWRADYNLILNQDDTRADLGAWVTVLNLSGASYPDAQLKLIAGDVQRITPNQARPMSMMRKAGGFAAAEDTAGFQEKSFFEYHMYTLPRRVDIDQNATQQLVLFPTVRDIKVKKVLVYYGLPDAGNWFFADPRTDRSLGSNANKKVDTYIQFENKENNHLGIPLPKGKVRAYKLDPGSPTASQAKLPGAGSGSLEFIGEDLIDHTAKNAEVLVKLGQAFDVTGDRTQTDFSVNTNGHVMTETIKITLKNAKDQPQDVIVKENLYRWVNWEITSRSDDYKKIDARTIHFPVTVPAEGEKTVTYTVKYTW